MEILIKIVGVFSPVVVICMLVWFGMDDSKRYDLKEGEKVNA